MDKDLKIIKKKYGEKMAHLCRKIFPSILEKEGDLLKILLDHFEPSHFLYDDLVNSNAVDSFRNYIYSFIEDKENEINNKQNTNKTPEELMSEAGYDLYECKTEEDIQRFKKYYKLGEELCTFKGGRLDSCYVYFAVRKDVENIRREDFKNPVRQDLYGTSVISIQFSKDETHMLSIKNRYNHTVNNSDATFGNNLDNIVPGLTESFAQYYGMIQTNPSSGFDIPNYVMAGNGKYYKYNYEIDNVYYCPNNIIIYYDKVKRIEKEKALLIDSFILGLVGKDIYIYDGYRKNGFPESIGDILKIDIVNNGENRIIYITPKVGDIITIEIDKNNCIIGYKNPNVLSIGDNFLFENKTLRYLELPRVQEVGKYFLYRNDSLRVVNLPSLKKADRLFMFSNRMLNVLNLPSLKSVEDYFLPHNELLEQVDLSSLEEVGLKGFMAYNDVVRERILQEIKRKKYFVNNQSENTIKH